MEKIKVRITGTTPLLMHAATGADPLNKLTKAHKVLTSKRKKTDEDYEMIAKSEWLMGLYHDQKLGPYISDSMLESSLIDGAKLRKLGTTFKRGVKVLEDKMALRYDGPREIEKMWDAGMYDARNVNVGRNKIMRYRPILTEWSFEATILYDEAITDGVTIFECLTDAGAYCGLGDYRPKFGRYEVKEL